MAERYGDGELTIALHIDLTHQRQIAVQSLAEIPGHAHVGSEVLIAIAFADVAAAGATESAARTETKGDAVLPGKNATRAGNLHRARVIPGAATVQVRSEQGVTLQTREQSFFTLDLYVHQNDGMVGIRDELLGDLVSSAGIGSGEANREGPGIHVLKLVVQVALFFVEESLFIGEEQLHVAGLRAVDCRVIDLVQRAVRHRVPDLAGGGVGGSDRVFSTRSPARLETRGAERRAVIVQPVVASTCDAHACY